MWLALNFDGADQNPIHDWLEAITILLQNSLTLSRQLSLNQNNNSSHLALPLSTFDHKILVQNQSEYELTQWIHPSDSIYTCLSFAGECACVGARLGTSSACREEWEGGKESPNFTSFLTPSILLVQHKCGELGSETACTLQRDE